MNVDPMLVVGLTGSIGMGKSTTATMFAEQGCPVFDADAAVRDLYAGKARPLVAAAFPGTLRRGAIDRELLGKMVLGDPAALRRLEAIVHPLVRKAASDFLADAAKSGAKVAVLDIPLLFEQKRDGEVDAVVVVSAPAEIQRARVIARPGMTEQRFEHILLEQMPDPEKRARADFVVDTGHGLEAAREDVIGILAVLADSNGPFIARNRARHGDHRAGPL